MTPTAYAIFAVAVMVIFALLTAYDRTRQQRDHHIIRADRAEADLASEKVWSHILFVVFEAEVAEHVKTEAALVEAGREAATHADHLEALLEATSETPSLRLVRGQR